jgi:arsenite-transporting ATPase
VQLDAGRTFDGLLDRYGGTPDAVAAVRRNPIYRSLAGALGGTQEYMAVERLYELSSSGHFDVVVIDTPPTRNAVDLLDAPQRLLSFLTHPIVRALLVPTRVSLRAASLGAAAAMRTIGAVVGTDLIGDVMGFFQAFSSLHEGFIERARAVHDLLQHEGTAFVLTTTPRADSLEEASWFTDQLSRRSLEVSAVVINRVHLSFTEHDPERLPIAVGSLGAQLDNLRHLERLARHDRAVLSTTASWAPTSVEIPRLADPPTDIAALVAIASHYM